MNLELTERFDLANNARQEIRYLVATQGISYLDAILHYSEKSKIELEVLAEIISKDAQLKAALQVEAEDLHFLKKIDRLPI